MCVCMFVCMYVCVCVCVCVCVYMYVCDPSRRTWDQYGAHNVDWTLSSDIIDMSMFIRHIHDHLKLCVQTCYNIIIPVHYILSRVKNESNRVSNALYAPRKMFSKSHTPEIQKLTNENA